MRVLGITASGVANALPPGYESIATVTASGGETSLTFSSIPQTYSSLQIRGIAKASWTSGFIQNLVVRVNGATSEYAYHWLQGDGTSTSGFGNSAISNLVFRGLAANYSGTSGFFSGVILDIHDYASTTRYKTVRAFVGANFQGQGAVSLNSGFSRTNTSAITSVSFSPESTTFVAGTTFALYGIKGAA